MAPFHLLSLPFLAFEQVITILELIEVFELSQVSRKAYTLIKLVKRKVQPIKITKDKDDQAVQVFEKYNELSFDFKALTEPVTGVMKLDGFRFSISEKDLKKNTVICYSHQFDSQFHHLVNYLSDLFHNNTNAFWVHHKKIREIENVIRNPISEKCVALQVMAYYDNEVKMKIEDLKLLLENKPRLEALMLFCRIEEPEEFRHVLSLPRVSIRYGQWVQIDDLMNSKSEVICLMDHSLEEEDITKYVHHWLSTDNSKIKQLCLNKLEERTEPENVLKDISYVQRSETNRPRFHRAKATFSMLETDCQNGLDIEKADGTIATTVFDSGSLKFVVWNNASFRVPKF